MIRLNANNHDIGIYFAQHNGGSFKLICLGGKAFNDSNHDIGTLVAGSS